MPRLLLISVLAFVVAPVLGDDDFPKIRNTQAAGEHPPSPTEMLDLFQLPPGFKVTLFAGEPDVQQPIAFDFDDFGRIWVAENYTYSARGKVDQQMRDRVIILHDKDGDGQHDERKVFWDKGRMLTGLTWGYGGLWILNDGTLSFIPDKDGDDVPDSEPVPMLNGWTKNAGHNVVNGLMWGPDGWLYGRHGITDTSYPGTIDTPKEERAPMNCGIWRFHPVKHTFEIVCHGTTNPWGLDYNEVGDMFMSNNVIGHLWHVIPGAHYQRMFGQDFNPHCYELMGPISDHYHWDNTGKWSQSRDGAADDLGGGHSHCGLMLYYGQNFPKEYWGKAFMCNTHGRCVNVDRIERKGSSYVAKHEPNFLRVNTPWFRGVEMKYGPAGCVYLTDWSDNGECHDHDGVHRTSGRIYRISYGEVLQPYSHPGEKRQARVPNEQSFVADLWDQTMSGWGTVWEKRRYRRLFYDFVERQAALHPTLSRTSDEFWNKVQEDNTNRGTHPSTSQDAISGHIDSKSLLGYGPLFLKVIDFEEQNDFGQAEILCSINAVSPQVARRLLLSSHDSVQARIVKHIFENPELRDKVRTTFYGVLRRNTSPAVAMAYASGLQKLLPTEFNKVQDPKFQTQVRNGTADSHTVLRLLTGNTPSARILTTDRSLKLMTWYAAVHHSLLGLDPRCPSQDILSWSTRLTVSKTNVADPDDLVLGLTFGNLTSFPKSTSIPHVRGQLQAILTGLRGRPEIATPKHWKSLEAILHRYDDPKITELTNQLAAVFGSKASLSHLHDLISDRSADPAIRSRATLTITEIQSDDSVPVLLYALNDKAIYVDICKALDVFDDDPRIPKELLKRWNSLRHGAKEAATDTLCSRKSYAVEFTKAIADGRVDSSILTAVQVRQLNTFNDESITEIVDEHWGIINETPEALEASIATWKKNLNDEVLAKADLKNGAALFNKSCGACHKLYGEGGKIGPDLTGGNRANMDYLLSNIINPSGEVPKQYTVSIVELKSGQVITGVVVGETEQVVSLQTDKELRTIAKTDIEQRTRTSKSLMPNGLLDALKPDEVRDLIAFIQRRR